LIFCVETEAFPCTFSDWKFIDEHERSKVEGQEKPREKVVSVTEMLDIIRAGRNRTS
jgi:hypothetical protein